MNRLRYTVWVFSHSIYGKIFWSVYNICVECFLYTYRLLGFLFFYQSTDHWLFIFMIVLLTQKETKMNPKQRSLLWLVITTHTLLPVRVMTTNRILIKSRPLVKRFRIISEIFTRQSGTLTWRILNRISFLVLTHFYN